jgi:hypothetical protein
MTTVDYFVRSAPSAFQRLLSWLTAIYESGRCVAGCCRSVIRMWALRHRDRQDVLNLLAQDHRAAADMGTTPEELRTWAQKPFSLP